MDNINYYNVLHVKSDCKKEDIEKQFRKLVLIYHPDKNDGDEETYTLITTAYTTLVNPVSRAEYDKQFGTKKTVPQFTELKTASSEFYDGKNYKPATDMDKKKFAEQMRLFDEKHGMKRSELNNNEPAELKARLQKVQTERAAINAPTNLFPDRFSLEKFNEVFEKQCKTSRELIPHNGDPTAWNNATEEEYCSYDKADVLYDDNVDAIGSKTYGSNIWNSNVPVGNLTAEDVKKFTGASYVKNHNEMAHDATYKKQLEQKIMAYRNEIDNLKPAEQSAAQPVIDRGVYTRSSAAEQEMDRIQKLFSDRVTSEQWTQELNKIHNLVNPK